VDWLPAELKKAKNGYDNPSLNRQVWQSLLTSTQDYQIGSSVETGNIGSTHAFLHFYCDIPKPDRLAPPRERFKRTSFALRCLWARRKPAVQPTSLFPSYFPPSATIPGTGNRTTLGFFNFPVLLLRFKVAGGRIHDAVHWAKAIAKGPCRRKRIFDAVIVWSKWKWSENAVRCHIQAFPNQFPSGGWFALPQLISLSQLRIQRTGLIS